MKTKVLVIIGDDIRHQNSLATLIRNNVNVIGVITCSRLRHGLPIDYARKAIKKHGLLITLGQILAGVTYTALNWRKDKSIYATMYDRVKVKEIIGSGNFETFSPKKINSQETWAWIGAREPDIIVIHTQCWIGKRILSKKSAKLVIGAHPGKTPHYRGSNSSFWALYQGKPEDVMYTIFVVDSGADTGAIIFQEPIPLRWNDSYKTIERRGMIKSYEKIADIITRYDSGSNIDARENKEIPKKSYYDPPTIIDYLRYRNQKHSYR